ncbi:MAG: hypothetical protein AB1515_03990 [Nitrospirota bacterium]
MSTLTDSRRLWIHAPGSDLLLFSYGWLAVLLPLLWLQPWAVSVIFVVIAINELHRHYTFALVYAEPEEFERRRALYLGLPVLAAVVAFAFVYAEQFPLLLTISVLWTIYHSVGQKYGITRIYARKAGYGEAWIEKGLIFSWFYYVALAMIEREAGTLERFDAGRVVLESAGAALPYVHAVSLLLLAVALTFTLLFARQEYLNRHRISLPKVLYVCSVLLLYAVFFRSLVLGYVVFGFSHALEYIALVNIFVGTKYRKRPEARSLLARASKQLWLSSGLFALVVVTACLLAKGWNQQAFGVYIVGSSFLHFIYDGLLWKVRRPEVGAPLGIRYAEAPSAKPLVGAPSVG